MPRLRRYRASSRAAGGGRVSRYHRVGQDRTYLVIQPGFGVTGILARNKVEARAKWLRAFKLLKMPRGTVILRGTTQGPVIE